MKARTDLLPCPNGSADGTNHHPWHKLPCIRRCALSRAEKRARSRRRFHPFHPSFIVEMWNGTRQLLPWKLFSPISISSFKLSLERNNRYFFFLLTVLSSSTQPSLSRHVCLDCRHFSRYTIRALRYTRSSCFVTFPLSSLTV